MNAAAARPQARILFVDDEQRVLTSMRAMFRRDYEVHLADSGAMALDILRRKAIDVVVSDQRMPEMTGVEVLREARDIAPATMRILLTGYADLGAIEDAINESEVFRYLMKPCAREQLRDTLALAVAAVRAGGGPVAPDPGALPRTAPAPERRGGDDARAPGVELLVLSADDGLFDGVRDAVHGDRTVRRAHTTQEALAMLTARPVGVLITDAGLDEAAMELLIGELKRVVPELVTVVASERSDAHMMINLINHGQVFRFLLKPLSIGQCRIWLSSAVSRHLELLQRPDAVSRYRVAERPEVVAANRSLVDSVIAGARALRGRWLGRVRA
ncbi:MAG TPA: response regulator [Pseudomonadales bacterium]|nr:response regulator [Pseudomonadales bacterium]